MAELVDPTQAIKALQKDVGKIEPELRKALRPRLKTVVEPIAADARGRASWSTRIPRAISVGVRFARDPGVYIRVRRQVAPHGRAFEGIAGNVIFQHPVFGHRDRSVDEETRSYLEPAVLAGADGVLATAAEAVDETARELGFR